MLGAGLRAGLIGGIAFSVLVLCSSTALGISAGWGILFGLATCCVLLLGFVALGGWAANIGGTAIATVGEALGSGAIAGGLSGIIAGMANLVGALLAFWVFGPGAFDVFQDQRTSPVGIGGTLIWGCFWLIALPLLGGTLGAIGGAMYQALRGSSARSQRA
ncbi:MAG: hypothetical protein HYZ68_02940 [Chloroflexi bacterium]|nr:hypothetical protein [Chloroflexota bacterium]